MWTNKSTPEIAAELREQGIEIGDDALRKILSDELGLSRRQAVKEESQANRQDRDEQFLHIAARRRWYAKRTWPIVSIDTKKKEILGDFFRPGRAWTNGQQRVLDHDFVTNQDRLVPFGVYDVRANEGFFRLARGSDSSELACDAIRRWWWLHGQRRWAGCERILLLCDCGGSNGYRQKKFKEDLCKTAAALGREIEVAHYPPGCSKYNPIEHRLFCHATRALTCVALRTIELARDLLRQTTTSTGLKTFVEIARRAYQTGLKASTDFLEAMPIRFGRKLPQFNYTALPWTATTR